MVSLTATFQGMQSPLLRSHSRIIRQASSLTAAAQSNDAAFKNTSSISGINDSKLSKCKEKEPVAAKKTVAELDEELRLKLEGRSGEGGVAGLELEDGRPAAMKRGVKNNMFRLI